MSHRPGVLGDVPCPHLEDEVLICEESRLPLQSNRPSTYFQFCLHGHGRFFPVDACLLAIVFILVLLLMEEMGQTQTTPLSLMTDHFSDVRERAHNLSMDIKKGKVRVFCISEWPSFNVGWPPEGTFNLTTLLQVKGVIFRKGAQGCPGQIPYILVWQELTENPPSWLKPFLPSRADPTPKVLALQGPVPKSLERLRT